MKVKGESEMAGKTWRKKAASGKSLPYFKPCKTCHEPYDVYSARGGVAGYCSPCSKKAK